MKKILVLFCFTAVLCAGRTYCQISDFTLDSCYFANTIEVHQVNIDSNILALRCAAEYGLQPGYNELIVFGLRFANMGNHDAAFNGLGLYFDSCHSHLHLENFGTCDLLNECGEVIRQGGKIGLNLYDGLNYMEFLLLPNLGNCSDTWLNQYGTPDYSLQLHPPNDNFNGEENMGLSAGYCDTYSNGTWGNNIRSNDIPNGNYYLRPRCNASAYFNQGLNIFPDQFTVPVMLTGQFPPSPALPRSISITSFNICY